VMIYLSYFTIVTVLYTVPFHAIRDVYISIRHFGTRTMDFIRYKKAVKNMNDKYSDATFEELRDMNDKTCIICRDELVFRGTPPANENNEGQQPPPPANDGLNDTPKKLPCGHIFHSHCLRSWLERQQTCPTWFVISLMMCNLSLIVSLVDDQFWSCDLPRRTQPHSQHNEVDPIRRLSIKQLRTTA
jgi:RING-H2 zinc finger domain